ncbi:Protein of unknown function (DUF3494) [Idiomarina sp. A28L]|uniref:Ig-like domain-containing protein n=1 Tax=Idiomarina sp. A28L TaxID=1036674 RepID=UPI00021385EA|nr:Ig-like domain-containing protein [Idiomarina sp. A28L]EGN74276.1 Protein of unknown function (DUF3494) [Idiomarina sp. A28L]
MYPKLSNTYKWLMLALAGSFLIACGDDGRDPILGNDGNVALSPTVTVVIPANNATDVAINDTVISAQFSEPMNSLTAANFTVTCESPCSSPSGTVSMNAARTIATYSVTSPDALDEFTVYTARIQNVTSSSHNLPLAQPYVWEFTTGETPDTTRPRVTITQPATPTVGATENVPVNTTISAVFSEDMLASTFTASSFTVTCAAPCVSPEGSVSYEPEALTAAFLPEVALDFNTTYTATITSAVTDLAGNQLAGNQGNATTASDYIWEFTTGDVADTTRPRVTITQPLTTSPGPTANVPVNTSVSAIFTEPMLATTITSASFTLTCAAPCVSPTGRVSYETETRSAAFTADEILDFETTYTATITTAATDLAGNRLAGNQGDASTASNYVWQFRTGIEPDTIRPRVTVTQPLTTSPGPTTNVPINTTISAIFTESMLATTISSRSFTLTCDAPCVSPVGSVSYEAETRSAAFRPAAELEPSTTYTAIIRSTVTDLAGNQLAGNQGDATTASNYIWQFTTSTEPDTTRPRVTITQPLTTSPGPTENVPVNTSISAIFTEDMLATTINRNNFIVTCQAPCVSPVGTVSYETEARTAVFVPSEQLESETTYTATVTSSVTDLAGNELAGNQDTAAFASDYIWLFTTSDAADTTRPLVTITQPLTTSPGPTTNVPINTNISAVFNEDMLASTITSNSFTVTCEAPCVSPSGTVSYEPEARSAVFNPTNDLEFETTYTATVTSSVTDLAGNQLAGNPSTPTVANDYTWQFTTGITPDTTRPRVTLTVPATSDPGPTDGVPVNTGISAVFSEEMLATTITNSSFTVTCEAPCVSPVGSVSYVAASRTAVFTPQENLEEGATYTATILSTVTDVAGNQLAGNQGPVSSASDYIWLFSTVEPIPVNNISVQSTDPIFNGTMAVCPNASINATFNIPSGTRIDPTTINDTTFLIAEDADPLNTAVAAESIQLDVDTGTIATFIPLNQLPEGVVYRATIIGGADGVKDLAVPGNEMLENYVWTFTTTPPTESCLEGPNLRTAAPFGSFGGTAGITNQGLLTVINGDIGTTGASTIVTGFVSEPGCEYTITTLNEGQVNGKIYTAPPPPTVACPQDGTAVTEAIAIQARLDAEQAYLSITPANLPGGQDPGNDNLGNLTLAPGIYTAQSGSFRIQGGNLTLDGQGNQNAVWVFQMATTLTVGGPGADFPQSVILVNGAQAKNIFWQVGSAATINAAGGGTMKGTIIAQEGVSISTAGNVNIVTLDGRALSLGASVTMVNTVINVPAE